MCRKYPHGVREMNAAATKRRIDTMIRMESSGWGDQNNALDRICARFKLPFGTLDNVRTGRTTRVYGDVIDAIRLAYLQMCEAEAKKWLHELAIERAKGNVDADLENLEREASDVAARVAAKLQRLRGDA